jgi:hypothetical protein
VLRAGPISDFLQCNSSMMAVANAEQNSGTAQSIRTLDGVGCFWRAGNAAATSQFATMLALGARCDNNGRAVQCQRLKPLHCSAYLHI